MSPGRRNCPNLGTFSGRFIQALDNSGADPGLDETINVRYLANADTHVMNASTSSEALDRPLEKSEAQEVAALLAQYRDQCLWFLREGYEPATVAEAARTLTCLEQYGDLRAWRAARRMREWLSLQSSAKSAAC